MRTVMQHMTAWGTLFFQVVTPQFQLALWMVLGFAAITAEAQNFSISGTKIYDPNGTEFIPRGANIGLWTDQSNATEVNRVKNVWKFNTVRVFLKLASGDANYPTDAFMDKYVNAYTVNTNGPKVVVQFECHDFSGSYYTDASTPSLTDLRNFWKRAAARYKNNPYVWFNVMNEPGATGPVSVNWRDMHNTVIADIRAQGANNVVVVDGNAFGNEDGNGTTKAAPINTATSGILTYGQEVLNADPQKRVLFSFHCYDGWRYSVDKMYDYVSRVHALNLAVHIGEFAATTGNSLGDYPVSGSAQNAIEVARTKGIGALVWHYDNGDGNALCTVSNGTAGGWAVNQTNGTTRPTNLTYLGELLWDFTHNLNPFPNRGIPLNRYLWNATSSRASNSTNANLAIDGSVDSALEIYDPTASDWFKLDLGASKTFNRILIDTRKFSSGFMRDFNIYVSADAGTDGTLVANVTGNTMAVNNVSFSNATGRYITIRPTLFGKSGGTYISWSIADLQVYAAGTYTPPVVGTTALSRTGWTASASKRSGWNGEWEIKALDGSYSSRYTSGASVVDGDHFTVDMKATQTFQSIVMNVGSSGNNFLRKFQVFFSNDGTNWGNAVYENIGTFVTKIVFASPQTARYIRIVNKSAYGDWWSIHEFFVYAPTNALQANAIYELIPQCYGCGSKRLDVAGGTGPNVQIYQTNSLNPQRWKLINISSNIYELQPQSATGSRLDAANGVTIGTANAGNSQRWKLVQIDAANGIYELEPQSSVNNRLDVVTTNGVFGPDVQIYSGNSSPAQRWKFVKISGGRQGFETASSAETLLRAFPNPAQHEFTLESAHELAGVQLLNSLGKSTYSRDTIRSRTVRIPLKGQTAGVYLVKATTAQGTSVMMRIVVTR